MSKTPSPKMPFHLSIAQLDNNTVQIELTLISVVQGLALAELAAMAIPLLVGLDWKTWPYIMASFTIILFFWAQAIIHTLRFIRWPLDLRHNFLYFTLLLIEVLAFSQITQPLGWFIANHILFIVAGILYHVDLSLIQERGSEYTSPAERRLFNNVAQDQLSALRYFVPLGLIYMPAAWIAIWRYPMFFINRDYHLLFIFGQVIIGTVMLVSTVRNWHRRAQLISLAAEEI